MRVLKWLMLAVMLVPASVGAARADGSKVVMGQINISFYAVTAGVVQQVLERRGMVDVEKMSARDTARTWMERNRDAVNAWFED